MRFERNGRYDSKSLRIDYRQSSIAIANDNTMMDGINPNIVGVAAEFNSACRLQLRAVQ
jgi:hypothetical protein